MVVHNPVLNALCRNLSRSCWSPLLVLNMPKNALHLTPQVLPEAPGSHRHKMEVNWKSLLGGVLDLFCRGQLRGRRPGVIQKWPPDIPERLCDVILSIGSGCSPQLGNHWSRHSPKYLQSIFSGPYLPNSGGNCWKQESPEEKWLPVEKRSTILNHTFWLADSGRERGVWRTVLIVCWGERDSSSAFL